MNHFFLSADGPESATWHADFHVGKMAMEGAQVLSAAHPGREESAITKAVRAIEETGRIGGDAGCLDALTHTRIIEVSGLDMTDATYLRQHVNQAWRRRARVMK